MRLCSRPCAYMRVCICPQYIRVMAPDAQCTETGPFFPPTPRYAIQNGIALDQNILKSPDWVVILVLMAAVFLVMVLLVVALVSA